MKQPPPSLAHTAGVVNTGASDVVLVTTSVVLLASVVLLGSSLVVMSSVVVVDVGGSLQVPRFRLPSLFNSGRSQNPLHF